MEIHEPARPAGLRARFDWQAEWLWTYAWEPYGYGKVLTSHGPAAIRWAEVPITMRYPGQGKRYTKIRPGLDWLKMIYPGPPETSMTFAFRDARLHDCQRSDA